MVIRVRKYEVKKPKGDTSKAHYSDKQKFEAVVAYMALGNMAIVSEAVSIPVDRLRTWKQAPWWKEIEAQIRQQKRTEISGKLSKVIDKAHKLLEDRLEHGDYRMDKNGNIYRVPVGAKVVSEIMIKSIDKQILLDKIEEAPEIKEEAVIDRLRSIEARLIEASKIKHPKTITVVPDSDGVYQPEEQTENTANGG